MCMDLLLILTLYVKIYLDMMFVIGSRGVIRVTLQHHCSNTTGSLILVMLNVCSKTLNYFSV